MQSKKINLNEKFSIKENRKIHRYISFEELVTIVETNSIKLIHLSKWEDPEEGKPHKDTIKMIDEVLKLIGEENATQGALANYKFIKNTARDILMYSYGSSWSKSKEHDAMWRIYSPNMRGVKIQTTANKLDLTLSRMSTVHPKHIFYAVGQVFYDNNPNPNDYSGLEGFFVKRKAFDHEKEVRAILYFSFPQLNRALKEKHEDAVYAKIDKYFIEKIIIDPRSEDWFVKTVKKYCVSKGIDKARIKRSELYGKGDIDVDTL